jgi:hypothetical protein
MPQLFNGQNAQKKVLVVAHSVSLRLLMSDECFPWSDLNDVVGCTGSFHLKNCEVAPMYVDAERQ